MKGAKDMTNSNSPIFRPPHRAHSRPSTPGVSFLHAASLKVPTKYSSDTAEVTRTLTPDALNPAPSSPARSRNIKDLEPASRSKTSLTLSLPEEETFGQPSIDLPGLKIARDFGFGLGIGSGTSRIEERRSVVVAKEVKNDSKEDFEDVNLDAHRRSVEEIGNKAELRGDEQKLGKDRRIAEKLDRREADEVDKSHGTIGLLKKLRRNFTRKCCCS